MSKKMMGFLVLLVAPISEASINDIFSEMYFRDYRSGQCQENTLHLVKRMGESETGVKDLFLIKLQNKGVGTFGLVNAEHARSWVQGKLIAEEKNWYEHWFLMDGLGTVYDFDFSFSPAPTPLADYVETMFLKEQECVTPSWTELCGKRNDKLNEYWVTVFDAHAWLQDSRRELWSGSMKSFLER